MKLGDLGGLQPCLLACFLISVQCQGAHPGARAKGPAEVPGRANSISAEWGGALLPCGTSCLEVF